MTNYQWVNSLWLSQAIWCHRIWSTVVQVMACSLMAPSHDHNLCWLIITEILWYSHETISQISILHSKSQPYFPGIQLRHIYYIQIVREILSDKAKGKMEIKRVAGLLKIYNDGQLWQQWRWMIVNGISNWQALKSKGPHHDRFTLYVLNF